MIIDIGELADGCGYILRNVGMVEVEASKRKKEDAMMCGACTPELDELGRPINPDIVRWA